MFTSLDMLAVWMPGAMELAIIAVVALLFFGRRLPEVAKSMGKSIVTAGALSNSEPCHRQTGGESPRKVIVLQVDAGTDRTGFAGAGRPACVRRGSGAGPQPLPAQRSGHRRFFATIAS